MLDADGLDADHFMILKGGMVLGIWSRQFAFGEAGRSSAGRQWLIPGQEYGDSAQGHINLLGTSQIIEPYSTGGMGWPKVVKTSLPSTMFLKKPKTKKDTRALPTADLWAKSPPQLLMLRLAASTSRRSAMDSSTNGIPSIA